MTVAGVTTTNAHGLVERERELAALEETFAEAAAGRGRLALVTAEAGGGKTALVGAFCAGRPPHTRLLRGTCDALFTPRPLGPIVDIAPGFGPGFTELLEGRAVPYRVASALVEELHRRGPTVLVVEDVHWADEATLDVLRVVARRIDSASALIVLTYRDEALGAAHPLRIVLGELAPDLSITRVPLDPLSRAAVDELANSHDVDPVALHAMTAGNPFFVTEVLASEGATMPATVRDAVLARAARLTPEARAVLEAVAIATPHAEPWLVETLAGEIDARLDECVSSGMLVSIDGAVAFRHELARLAVEGSLTGTRKLSLHRAALATIAARDDADANLARIAHHADAANDGEAVLRFAPLAGARAASVGAHREAAEQYTRALRYGSSLRPAERADLLKRLSRECYLTDQADQAIESLRTAIECYRELGDRAMEGETMATLAEILWCPGRGDEARATAREAVQLLEQLPPGRELATACETLSFLLAQAADIEAALEWAHRALEIAQQLGEPDVLCTTQLQLARTEISTDPKRGAAEIELGGAHADRLGLHDLAADAYLVRAASAAASHQYDVAHELFGQGLACCREHGNDLIERYLLAFQARAELDRGLWAEAVESVRPVLARRFVSTSPRTIGLTVLALVRARRGDPDVLPLLDEARSLADPTHELPRIAPVAAAGAEIAWLRADGGAAREATTGALELAVQTGSTDEIARLQAWRRRAGIEERAHAAASGPYALELAGDPAAAAANWSKLGHPYEAALALADVGSEEALRESLDALDALGGRGAAAVVSRRLRELGVRGVQRGARRATRDNAAGLTPRESEVLELVADGLRNADIAQRLFLSPRTVDHHVSAILRKLNAGSRGEAVASAQRLGLLQDR